MNRDRRREIARASSLVSLALQNLAEAKEILEAVKDEEQEYFDNMPESFQSGDKGQAAETAIDKMDEAISAIEDFENASVEDALSEASA